MDDLNTIDSKDLVPAEKLPSFSERLLAIFVEPKVVFDFIAKRTDFWYSFIGLAVMGSIGALLALPTQMKSQELMTAAMGAPGAAKAITITAYILTPLQTALSLLIMMALLGALIWVVIMVVAGGGSYLKAINVAVWTTYPAILASFINGIVVFITRPEIASIQTSTLDSSPVMRYTSLAMFAPPDNLYITMMLLSVSLFSIWGYWLLYIATRRALGGNATAAWILIIVLVVFSLGFSLFGAWGLSKVMNL